MIFFLGRRRWRHGKVLSRVAQSHCLGVRPKNYCQVTKIIATVANIIYIYLYLDDQNYCQMTKIINTMTTMTKITNTMTTMTKIIKVSFHKKITFLPQ